MWLDWDNAVSIVANDWEVKQTYENILCSPNRPTLFFDVGANNGTHALLMAAQGLKVVAFEPNSTCIDNGRRLLSANNLQVQWEHVAVGSKNGTVKLNYSPMETYLGSVVDAKAGENRSDLISEVVKLVPLDDYVPLAEGHRLLIKIDVEGFEIEVLEGAKKLLTQAKPTVIFESNLGSDREFVFNLLKEYGYVIYELPWPGSTLSHALTNSSFAQSQQTNFAAVPS
jgi:FkbM family methyltransferase